MREQLGNLVDEIRTKFREQKVGYRGLAVSDGENPVFALRDDTGRPTSKNYCSELNPDLDVDKGADAGAYSVTFNEKWQKVSRAQIIEQSLEIVGRRVNETGTKEPIIQRQGDTRILLQVPGLADPEHLKSLLGRTAKMTFHMVDESVNAQDVERGLVPPGTRIVPADEHDYESSAKADM